MSKAAETFLRRAGKTVVFDDTPGCDAPRAIAQTTVPVATRWPLGAVNLDRVLIRPMEPERTLGDGTLAAAQRSVQTQIALNQVGQIAAIGPLAWTAKTREGLDYAVDMAALKYAVGDWVFYRPKAGVPMLVRKHVDHRVDVNDSPRQLIMEERDILYKFENYEEARLVWSWVQ